MKKRENSLIILFVIILFTSPLFSQIGLTAGNEYGLGGIIQLSSPAVKFEVGGGVTPLLVIWAFKEYNYYSETSETSVKFYFPACVGVKIGIILINSEKRNELSLKFGYTYNTLIKGGFGGGIDYLINREKTIVGLTAGVMYYPNAFDELFKKLFNDKYNIFSKDDVSSIFTNFQPFIGIYVVF
jgi:hypothetical protein